jgi:hypothetical protein
VDRTGCVPLGTGQVDSPWGQNRFCPPGDRTGCVPLGPGDRTGCVPRVTGQVGSPEEQDRLGSRGDRLGSRGDRSGLCLPRDWEGWASLGSA